MVEILVLFHGVPKSPTASTARNTIVRQPHPSHEIMRRRHEIPSHLCRYPQPQHPRGAARIAGQADRGSQGAVRSNSALPAPRRTRNGVPIIHGTAGNPLCGLGWKSLGVLELTALPSVAKEAWIPVMREADALLMSGGDVWYLRRWMQESGLAELMSTLHDIVYVGISAGSMVTAPVFGETYGDPCKPFVIDRGLGLVDFAVLPHVDHEDHPESTMLKVDHGAGSAGTHVCHRRPDCRPGQRWPHRDRV